MINPFIVAIWTYCKYNFIKSTSSQLRSLTSMLMGVLFWKYP